MFTNTQLTAALNAYGTNASTHVSRLTVLADMRETDNATIEDIALAIRHAAACDELGVPFDDSSAATLRAVERITGYSDSTFARYSMVLQWLAPALGNDETMPALLNSETFTPEALSALVQLASGKVASRKVASDSVANAISKRDSAAIVATYRRLLAAKTAKTNAAKTRAKSEKATTTTTDTAEMSPSDNAPSVTRESVIESLDTFALVKILSARIAANVDELTPKQFEELADELAGISAMIEA